MMVFLWLWCGLSFLSSATVNASVIYQDAASKVHTPVANSSSMVSIDPRFGIDPTFDGPKLPLISVLMSIVSFLVDLGLQDFLGTTKARARKLKKYPEVQIAIVPNTAGGSIERRFVIWGLTQTAGLMMNSRRFQTFIMTLKWQGEQVGELFLTTPPPSLATSEATLKDLTQALSQDVNPPTAASAAKLSDFPKNSSSTFDASNGRFNVEASLDGSTLDLFDVFRMVIAVLSSAAELEASQRITEYSSPPGLAGVGIFISTPSPVPTHPPYFETQWLLKLMAAVPEQMIKKGVFKEGKFVAKVDGVTVANARVRKKLSGSGLRPSPPVLLVS